MRPEDCTPGRRVLVIDLRTGTDWPAVIVRREGDRVIVQRQTGRRRQTYRVGAGFLSPRA